MSKESLVRGLGFKEAGALVVGTVIGTGVFLKAAVMSQNCQSPSLVLIAWAVGGLLSLAGALCYAELGALFPKAGGEYVYLREAYGDLSAFLYGWMRFWIGNPGSIAAYAVGAATFLNAWIPLGTWKIPLALLLILTLSLINCFSVSVGGRVQTFMTSLKILMVLGLAFALLFLSPTGNWENFSAPSAESPFTWSAFGAALLAALWAYDGWNNMPMAAGEVSHPEKNIPRALVFGMILIFGLYLLINAAYFYTLPFHEILTSYSKPHPEALPVATKAAFNSFGVSAVGLLSFAFVLSALGSLNGSILTGARVPFAMARDGLFIRALGEVSHRTRVPVISVVIQAAVAMILALSGTFDQLTDYVVFASWIFYALVTASLFVLRKKKPDLKRPYRAPFYPVLPILFIVCSVLLLINTLLSSPQESGIGLGFILIGVPFYFWFQKRQKNQ